MLPGRDGSGGDWLGRSVLAFLLVASAMDGFAAANVKPE